MDEIRLLGAAVGEEARAEALAGGIAALLADLERRLARVRPVRVLYYDPPTYTMGRGTLVGEILARAGGANVVDELGIVGPGQIGIETVLALEPEAIIMPNYADNTSDAARAGRRRDLAAGARGARRPRPRDPRRLDRDRLPARRAGPRPRGARPAPRGRSPACALKHSHRPRLRAER